MSATSRPILTVLLLLIAIQAGYAACYSSVNQIQPTCSAGTLSLQELGSCRSATCTNGAEQIKVLACNKPDGTTPQYFEMYKQSATGSSLELCFGTTCIRDAGYAKSPNYPICDAACTPTTEVCDGKDNDCDTLTDENNVCTPVCTPTTELCNGKDDNCNGQIDENNVCVQNTCYSSVQNIPASCTGATITSDTWNGCRTIVCGTTQTLACDKSGYFEMYKQSGGNAVKICIDGTCIQDNGYAKSSAFPICTNTCVPTTEVCDSTDNNCNGQVDENNVCGVTCTPSTEVCDGKDNNCNGQTDENNVCTPVCNPVAESCNSKDDDCDGQVDEENVCSTQVCYTKVNDVPAACTGGTITSDVKGGCRTIVCSGLQVQACDKSGFFEMYKQSSTVGVEICLAGTCIRDNGYAKSGNYPVCTQVTNPPNTTDTYVDLLPVQVTGSSNAVAGQGNFTINATIRNNGTAASAGFVVRFYLSADPMIDTGDAYMGEQAVNSLGANIVLPITKSLVMPFNMPQGTYYYGIVIDELREVAESNEQNNAMAGAQIAVTVPSNFCQRGVTTLPAYCNGGRISSQVINGSCMQIVCQNSTASISASACDQPASNPSSFYVQRTAFSGNSPSVCVGGVCVDSFNGFGQSATYPVCNTVCVAKKEACDGVDNDCDGQVDEGSVCTADPSCKPLFPGHNDASAHRVNVVVVGHNYPDMNEFYSVASSAVDLNGNITTAIGVPNYNSVGPGLMELAVYKDNKDKFNFWYVDKVYSIPTPSSAFNCYDPDSYNHCGGLSNKYQLNLCKNSFRSYAWFGGESYVSSTDSYDWPNLFDHEFQHQFPQLADEYVESANGDRPRYPNCAGDLSHAQSWWSDRIGQVGQDGNTVGYYAGCSYTSDNYRPVSNTIMRSRVFNLGLISEQHIASVLSQFSGTAGGSSAMAVELAGNPADVGSYEIVSVKEITAQPQVNTLSTPHSLKIKMGTKIFEQGFSTYDEGLSEDFTHAGEIHADEYVKRPKNTVTVIVPVEKSAGASGKGGVPFDITITSGNTTVKNISYEKIKEKMR
jgi:hypothetical protein